MKKSRRIFQIIVFCVALCVTVNSTISTATRDVQQSDIAEKAKSLRPNVLVDQSHDFLFVVLHVGFFLKYNDFLGTLSSATLNRDLYRNCDVVVTHQGWSDVPYTDSQIGDLKAFVEGGGGLVLIGSGNDAAGVLKRKNLSFETWSMNSLAAAFGFEFQSQKGHLPLRVKDHAMTSEFYSLITRDKNPTAGVVKIPAEAAALVTDSAGSAVIAVRDFGKGRIVVISDYRFCQTIDDSSNARFFIQLFEWAGEHSQKRFQFAGKNPQKIFPGIELHKGWDYETANRPNLQPNWDEQGSDFIWPEKQIQKESIVFQYSEALESHVRFLIEQYPVMYQTIFDMLRCEPYDRVIIQALPTGGGGYHWTKQNVVAIGCLTDSNRVLGVMGHEMVHAWGLPTPRNFSHGWTTFTDDYIARKLQLYPKSEIEKNWNTEVEKVRNIDPYLDSLDITEKTADPVRQRLLDKKVGWLLKVLYDDYGMGAFITLIRLCRNDPSVPRASTSPDEPTLSLDDFIYYLSKAVHRDLYPWFKKYGATVHPRAIKIEN